MQSSIIDRTHLVLVSGKVVLQEKIFLKFWELLKSDIVVELNLEKNSFFSEEK